MTATVDELVGVLAAEAERLRRLLPLLEEQERALQGADAQAAMDLAERQARLAGELRALEQTRRAVVARLAAEVSLPPGQLTLSTLVGRLPRAPIDLTRLRGELQELGRRVTLLTQRNAFLLERSIGYVRGLLWAIVSVASPDTATYGASGRADHPLAGALGVVDRQA